MTIIDPHFEPEDDFNPCYHCKHGHNIRFDFTPIPEAEIPAPCNSCTHGFGDNVIPRVSYDPNTRVIRVFVDFAKEASDTYTFDRVLAEINEVKIQVETLKMRMWPKCPLCGKKLDSWKLPSKPGNVLFHCKCASIMKEYNKRKWHTEHNRGAIDCEGCPQLKIVFDVAGKPMFPPRWTCAMGAREHPTPDSPGCPIGTTDLPVKWLTLAVPEDML